MALHNLARMTSATAGTGTLTLGSAVSGFLSFADAGVANGEVVTYAIRDGANSEIGRGTYTSSGTTLSRDTVYESTNSGNKISCSGGQEVFVTAAAENIWKAPTVTTVTTSNLAAAINTCYVLDVSGLTADRNFVVPAGAPGDWLEVNISTGDDAYELIIIGDTGITINGGSAATEWSRLFIAGETVRLIATSATNWQVMHDGRIPCVGQMTLSANDTTNTAATDTTPTWDNAVINTGSVCDLVNYRINIRRAGYYTITGNYGAVGNVSDQNYTMLKVFQNLVQVHQHIFRNSGSSAPTAPGLPPKRVLCAVGDYLLYQYRTQETNIGIASAFSYFQVEEE